MDRAADGMSPSFPAVPGPQVLDAAGPAVPPAKAVFELHLANFSGPFDLLLGLISKRELDITEIALAEVTDEFISHIRRLQAERGRWALDEASEFLVVAATLLDLKAARLLPSGEVEDAEDVALLEARDLLFARLLQYKAFKEISHQLGARLEEEAQRYPRSAPLEPQFAAMLPELIWRTSLAEFTAIAAKALQPREPATTEVGIGHLHGTAVSVKEQAALIEARLRESVSLSFRELTDDASSTLVVVVRFLALLEMFRDAVISFEQAAPLGELRVRWSAGDTRWSAENIRADYDGLDSDAADAGAAAPAEDLPFAAADANAEFSMTGAGGPDD